MRYFENAVVMLPIAAFLAAIGYLPFLIKLHRAGQTKPIKHIANYTLTGYALMLAWVVFLWAPTFETIDWEHRINLTPFSELIYAYECDGGAWSSQVMWNVFLFIPLGFLLPCVFQRFRSGAWKTILFCLGLTICIETVQLLIGRTADVDDVLANLVGGVMGHAVHVILCRWFQKTEWTKSVLSPPPTKLRLALAYTAAGLTLGLPTVGDIILKLVQ
ncbi:MAG: VanZ family protein [Clostridia bacterium]|nr:VanZ family protein [Clostridia bacterium]